MGVEGTEGVGERGRPPTTEENTLGQTSEVVGSESEDSTTTSATTPALEADEIATLLRGPSDYGSPYLTRMSAPALKELSKQLAGVDNTEDAQGPNWLQRFRERFNKNNEKLSSSHIYHEVNSRLDYLSKWMTHFEIGKVGWRKNLSGLSLTPLALLAILRENIGVNEFFSEVLRTWWLIRTGYSLMVDSLANFSGPREKWAEILTDLSLAATEVSSFITQERLYLEGEEEPWIEQWKKLPLEDQMSALIIARVDTYLSDKKRRDWYRLKPAKTEKDERDTVFVLAFTYQNKKYYYDIPISMYLAAQQNDKARLRLVDEIRQVVRAIRAGENLPETVEFTAQENRELARQCYRGTPTMDPEVIDIFSAHIEVILDEITDVGGSIGPSSKKKNLLTGGGRAIEALAFSCDESNSISELVVCNSHNRRQGIGSLEIQDETIELLLKMVSEIRANFQPPNIENRIRGVLPNTAFTHWRTEVAKKEEWKQPQLRFEWFGDDFIERQLVNNYLQLVGELIKSGVKISLLDVLNLARLLQTDSTSLQTIVSQHIDYQNQRVEVLDTIVVYMTDKIREQIKMWMAGNLSPGDYTGMRAELMAQLQLMIEQKTDVTKNNVTGLARLFACLATNNITTQRLLEIVSSSTLLAGSDITQGISRPPGSMSSLTYLWREQPSIVDFFLARQFIENLDITLLEVARTITSGKEADIRKLLSEAAVKAKLDQDSSAYHLIMQMIKPWIAFFEQERSSRRTINALWKRFWRSEFNKWRRELRRTHMMTAISDIYREGKKSAAVMAFTNKGEDGLGLVSRATPDMMRHVIADALANRLEQYKVAPTIIAQVKEFVLTYFNYREKNRIYDFTDFVQLICMKFKNDFFLDEQQWQSIMQFINDAVQAKMDGQKSELLPMVEAVLKLLKNERYVAYR